MDENYWKFINQMFPEERQDHVSFQRVHSLLHEAEMLGEVNDPVFLKNLVLLSKHPDNEGLYLFLSKRLLWKRLSLNLRPTPFIEPKASQLPKDGAVLGHTLGGVPVFAPEALLCQNTVGIGDTGAGKSNHIAFIAQSLADSADAVCVADFRKIDSRQIYTLFKRKGKTLHIVPWQKLLINPLQPPQNNVDPRLWLHYIVDEICILFGIQSFSRSLLMNICNELYNEYGVYDGKKIYPNFFDVKRKLENPKLPQQKYFLLEKIGFLCLFFKDVHVAWGPEAFATRNFILEFGGLDQTVSSLMMTYIVESQFVASQAETREDKLPFRVLVLEEALKAVSEKGKLGELSTVNRSSKIALISFIQSLTYNVSKLLVENACIQILYRSGLDSLEYMARMMAMNVEQKEWCKTNLTPGLVVARFQFEKFQYPFILRVPLMNLPSVSDTDVRESQSGLEDIQVVWRKDVKKVTVREEMEFDEEEHTPSPDPVRECKRELPENEEIFLIDLCQHPFVETVERYRRLNFSNKKGNKIKGALLQKDYIEAVEVPLGKHGRPKLYAITEKGKTCLERLGYTVGSSGRGSILHKYYQHLIKEKLEQSGLTARLETPTDVFVQNNGNRMGIEILTDARTEQLDRVKRKLPLVSILFIVCPTQNVLEQIKEMVNVQFSEKNKENIRFFVINDFLEAIQKDLLFFPVSPATE